MDLTMGTPCSSTSTFDTFNCTKAKIYEVFELMLEFHSPFNASAES